MQFEWKTSIFLVGLGLGCIDEDSTSLRAGPLPDTTLPEDNEPGTGEGFQHGVVTTSEPLAAQIGAQVLAEGGNAIDAAVAVMFANNVVEPQSSGIGGGGFMMIYLADSKQTRVLNCRERSPKAMTPDVFGNPLIDFALRSSSGYAVGVPGEVACAATALENWGTITLAEALQPAIEAASGGITVSSRLARDISTPAIGHKLGNETDPNSKVKEHYDVARDIFRPNGVALVEGDLLVQPDLAATFQLIAEGGPDAFYHCGYPWIANAIIDTQQVTRTGNPKGKGKMKCKDLESYEVEIQDPISRPYREYKIVTIAPPSSGGIALLQELALLEAFPIGDDDAGFGFGDYFTINVMLDSMRLAFADRAIWVGDETCQGCFDVPVAGLLSDAYLAQRALDFPIQVGHRLTGITAGDPRPFEPEASNEGVLVGPGSQDSPGDNTSHVTIVDEEGNIVTYTMSIEATWGTGLVVPGYGFLLNNELTDFNATPTFNPDPEAFNPGANDPGPEKRPRSSMAPTMIFLGDEPVAAYGSPGGSQIINVLLNVTLNLIDHDLTLQESVNAPRISVNNAADTGVDVQREDGFDPAVIDALRALGYSFPLNPIAIPVPGIGAVQAIIRIPASNEQFGFSDFRRIGGVAGP